VKGETAQESSMESGDGARPAVAGEIRSRDDAVRMLELVCNYLERHEPSNPAPLFIRRAQRLIKKSFMEIVRDLMPDSLSQLEKLAGDVDKT
jgi:type VI secretion system protein ImpA